MTATEDNSNGIELSEPQNNGAIDNHTKTGRLKYFISKFKSYIINSGSEKCDTFQGIKERICKPKTYVIELIIHKI